MQTSPKSRDNPLWLSFFWTLYRKTGFLTMDGFVRDTSGRDRLRVAASQFAGPISTPDQVRGKPNAPLTLPSPAMGERGKTTKDEDPGFLLSQE